MELSGLGVSVDIEDSLPNEKIWTILLRKIQRPQDYLPVFDVITKPTEDGNGTYREMSIEVQTKDGVETKRIVENIYAYESSYEVQFVVLSNDSIHINKIITSPEGKRTLEFYLRLKDSEERVPWNAPRDIALKGINAVLQKAREL